MTSNSVRKQGRPIGSAVRQNIIEILYYYHQLYGYEIYKIYCDLFPTVTMRLIYYHLKKGVSTKEFVVQKIDIKKGSFSWGETTQNVVYALGPEAKPVMNEQVLLYKDRSKEKLKK